MSRFAGFSMTFLLVVIGLCGLSAQSSILLEGRIIDTRQRPVPFATVSVLDKDSKDLLSGAISEDDGSFAIELEQSNIIVEISYIGYITETIESIEVKSNGITLGDIVLKEDSKLLEEVIVEADRSTTEFKLDRRVFNVGSDLSSSGASALEVLNNVPSVNVNIEGAISLRGSAGVQVLINGKPSVIASEQGNSLGTITADMIEKVEVITNPSAKYDAEGTTGIINIILKKEERKGLNGSISLNTGLPQNHSVGISLNRRTERFNLFSQLGAGYRELPRFRELINRDLITNRAIRTDGVEYRNEQFYNLVLGTDYYINQQNILTLSGSFAYEIEDQPSDTEFEEIDSNGDLVNKWQRTEVTEATNPKYQFELQYVSDFADAKEHKLLISALGNFFGKDQSSDFKNENIFGNIENSLQETRTNFKEARYTFKLDYTKPFLEKYTLETGLQYVLQNVSNDFAVSDFINEEWVENVGLTNIFEYEQNVFGAYTTLAYEGERFGVKGGLRLEHTDLSTLLVTTNESNQQQFINLFPSGFVSYKFSEQFSMQAGYSRRIYRPRLWDLNPFFNIRNNFSIYTGNPNLLPEFTDSYEISSIFIVGDVSLNFSIYQRYTSEVIERISTFEDNVTTFLPVNIGTNRSTGLELNGKYNITNSITLMGDINYNYFNREGVLEGQTFDFSASQWSTDWTTKIKLPLDFSVEVSAQYISSFQTVQGNTASQLFADFGLRKKLFKNKAVLSLAIRDIFASRIRENETTQPNFYIYSRDFRGRFATLGFSYGFGKGEAMEYSGSRRYF